MNLCFSRAELVVARLLRLGNCDDAGKWSNTSEKRFLIPLETLGGVV